MRINLHLKPVLIYTILIYSLLTLTLLAQKNNTLSLHFEGSAGLKVFLAAYEYNQIQIIDSTYTDAKGRAIFNFPEQTWAGMYLITDSLKTNLYFDFFIDGIFPVNINAQLNNAITTLHSSTHGINESYFELNRKLSDWNRELERCQVLQANSNINAIEVSQTITRIQKRSLLYCDSLFKINYTNVFGQMLKLKINPPRNYSKVPADSIRQRLDFKTRYWQFIDFSKPELITNPFISTRIQDYFEHWVTPHPDSVTSEVFRLISKMHMQKKSKTYVISQLISMYETRNELIFEKSKKLRGMQDVFVELINTYVRSGFLDDVYDTETKNRIISRIDQIEPLLTGKPLPELLVLDTMNTRIAQSWGFKEGISTETAQQLYQKRKDQLETMFYSFNTKSGPLQLLIFWSTDCPHCISDLPVIQDSLKSRIQSGQIKVMAINLKDSNYNDWLDFIREKNLNYFKHYCDPIHLNQFKTKFDIQATPALMLLDAESTIISRNQNITDLILTLNQIQNINSR